MSVGEGKDCSRSQTALPMSYVSRERDGGRRRGSNPRPVAFQAITVVGRPAGADEGLKTEMLLAQRTLLSQLSYFFREKCGQPGFEARRSGNHHPSTRRGG